MSDEMEKHIEEFLEILDELEEKFFDIVDQGDATDAIVGILTLVELIGLNMMPASRVAFKSSLVHIFDIQGDHVFEDIEDYLEFRKEQEKE